LVIDDDELVRDATAELLRSAGYIVAEAENGTNGLALLNEIEPAVALIDFLMPGLNGAEVARLARLQRPTLPIIFVSGYSDTIALDQIAGAVVLRKPVPSLVLLAAVELAANDAQMKASSALENVQGAMRQQTVHSAVRSTR
jgi:CheY-like chemotaxis protein